MRLLLQKLKAMLKMPFPKEQNFLLEDRDTNLAEHFMSPQYFQE